MSKNELTRIVDYYPAVVRTTTRTGLYIDYYVYEPSSDKMVRRIVQIKRLLNRYGTKRDKQLAAQKIADEINAKLKGGWTPLRQTEDGRLYTKLPDLEDRFLRAKKAEGCRPTTLIQYKSVIDLWLRWCEDNGFADRYSGTYLRSHAVRYMDYVLEQGHRHRSYNNTIKVMKAFFQWALEHMYSNENPFLGIKTLKKEQKIRILVPPEARKKISSYYAGFRPAMNIVCQLVYSSAIRPAEIMKIQLRHIDIDNHYIVIPGENAKNHKERFASLTPALQSLLEPILTKYQNLDFYLFGKNEFLDPDVNPVNKSYFQKSWERMRKATGLPKEMQLYSLRDTGLTDLLHAGIDQLTVQHHADHSSLAIQNIYTNHFDPNLNKTIYEKAPEF